VQKIQEVNEQLRTNIKRLKKLQRGSVEQAMSLVWELVGRAGYKERLKFCWMILKAKRRT
jgi:restriction endonuclease Mrr